MRIAVIGDPGIGKSWFTATMPGINFSIDFDGRASSLAGKENVIVKTYTDVDTNNPRAIADLEADISKIKYDKTQGKPIPDTFILDSITYARKYTEAELIRQQSTLGRSLRVGAYNLKIGSGWDIVNGNRGYLEYLINTLGELGNVIAVFHVADEKDRVKSTPQQAAYTGRITVSPQYLNSILSIFNDCWYLDVDYQGKRFVQTGIDSEFIGKCSLKGLDPKREEPNIAKMLQKHRDFIVKEKQNGPNT
jgi:hypothetical protein